MRDQLPVESLVDALQDSVHKECGGVRAVSGRPPCNPMTTQCPRCNNSVAECDSGRDTDLDLDDVAATSQKAKAELEELRAELAKVNNEFGCETADWPNARVQPPQVGWSEVLGPNQPERKRWLKETLK
jgi:hypothetical protein